ncbi:MAG: hypothetical protein U1C04_18775 [Hydrogenophaga sp.]|uniref:hypothetical protein n=1 Tax=Hydrogenophaga sp. TaxID=1904254 RepID=UPI002AB8EF28|nr:hypothetical protein [Hydrogenophaga sp.]MDZ4282795.1 hypothetical protein [Hydrogenophaga sp.]
MSTKHLHLVPGNAIPPGIEALELNEIDSGFALLDHFGIADFANTQPAELTLVPIEPEPVTFKAEASRALRAITGAPRYEDVAFGIADRGARS